MNQLIDEGLNANSDKKEISKESIQESAKHDICRNTDDLKQSQTVKRIIHYTAQKTSGFIDLNLLAQNGITKIYDKFIKQEPITKQEKNHLLLFFKMDSSHKVAQEVISKLFILIGSENSEFVKTFLKDKNGQLSDSKFIQHIIYELENYKFVIDIDGTIEKIDTNNFSYSHQGKYGIMHKMNGKFFSSYGYLEPVKILDTHMFFGIKENTMRGHIEKIGTSGGSLPYAYDEKIGIIIICNGSDFEEIYKKPGIQNIKYLGNDILIAESETEKKGALSIESNSIEEILPVIYEKIDERNGFLLSANKNDQNGNFLLGIHKFSNQTLTTIMEEECIDDRLDLLGIKYNPNTIGSFYHLYKNYYELKTKNGINIYRYFEKENMFDLVPGLDWIESISSEHKFFDREPVIIKFTDGTSGIYIFDEISSLITCLVKFKNNNNSVQIHQNGDLFQIYHQNTQSTQYMLYYDDILFQLKKGYKHIKDKNGGLGYIKKGFFGTKIPLTTSFEEMQEYFYECNFVLNI